MRLKSLPLTFIVLDTALSIVWAHFAQSMAHHPHWCPMYQMSSSAVEQSHLRVCVHERTSRCHIVILTKDFFAAMQDQQLKASPSFFGVSRTWCPWGGFETHRFDGIHGAGFMLLSCLTVKWIVQDVASLWYVQNLKRRSTCDASPHLHRQVKCIVCMPLSKPMGRMNTALPRSNGQT